MSGRYISSIKCVKSMDDSIFTVGMEYEITSSDRFNNNDGRGRYVFSDSIIGDDGFINPFITDGFLFVASKGRLSSMVGKGMFKPSSTRSKLILTI